MKREYESRTAEYAEYAERRSEKENRPRISRGPRLKMLGTTLSINPDEHRTSNFQHLTSIAPCSTLDVERSMLEVLFGPWPGSSLKHAPQTLARGSRQSRSGRAGPLGRPHDSARSVWSARGLPPLSTRKPRLAARNSRRCKKAEPQSKEDWPQNGARARETLCTAICRIPRAPRRFFAEDGAPTCSRLWTSERIKPATSRRSVLVAALPRCGSLRSFAAKTVLAKLRDSETTVQRRGLFRYSFRVFRVFGGSNFLCHSEPDFL